MSEDASLDDFLADESSEQSEAADAADARVDEESASETDPADAAEAETAAAEDAESAADAAEVDIDPARTTYAWSGDGAACEDCGETVERRWQQDGGLVCIECKDWERA